MKNLITIYVPHSYNNDKFIGIIYNNKFYNSKMCLIIVMTITLIINITVASLIAKNPEVSFAFLLLTSVLISLATFTIVVFIMFIPTENLYISDTEDIEDVIEEFIKEQKIKKEKNNVKSNN